MIKSARTASASPMRRLRLRKMMTERSSRANQTGEGFEISREHWTVDPLWTLLELPPDFPLSAHPISHTIDGHVDGHSEKARLRQANVCESIAYSTAECLDSRDLETEIQESVLLQVFFQLNQKLLDRVTPEETFWIVRRTADYLEWECPELNLESGCKACEEASKRVSEDD